MAMVYFKVEFCTKLLSLPAAVQKMEFLSEVQVPQSVMSKTEMAPVAFTRAEAGVSCWESSSALSARAGRNMTFRESKGVCVGQARGRGRRSREEMGRRAAERLLSRRRVGFWGLAQRWRRRAFDVADSRRSDSGGGRLSFNQGSTAQSEAKLSGQVVLAELPVSSC